MNSIHSIINKKCKGFSLFEMSIVLCIMGVISAYAIPAWLQARNAARLHETDAKMAALLYAFAGYAQRYDVLPFAAKAPNATENATDGTASTGLLVGIVPYATLKIQKSEAQDAFGRWFTYAVSDALANKPKGPTTPFQSGSQQGRGPHDSAFQRNTSNFCAVKPNLSSIDVKSPGSLSLVPRAETDFIALLIISHGPSGAGAFNYNGVRIPTNTHEKAINADNTLTYIEAPASQTFDDRIRWVTRNNLMSMYAKAPCPTTTIYK